MFQLLALVGCDTANSIGTPAAEKSLGYPDASAMSPPLAALSPVFYDGSGAQLKTERGTVQVSWDGERLSADVRELDHEGASITEWLNIRTAMNSVRRGAAFWEHGTDTLHFVGFANESDSHSASIAAVYAYANLATHLTGDTWFQVALPFFEADYGPLPAMTVDEGRLYVASIEHQQATLMSCSLDALDCRGRKETVSAETRPVAGIGMTMIAGSPLVAWSTSDEGASIVESRIMTESGWSDPGVIQLPMGFDIALGRRATATLEILQGYGRVLLVVHGDGSVATPYRDGQVAVYELSNDGWRPLAHLAYPTAPNSTGEPAINARLTEAGLVILSVRCTGGYSDQCGQTGWRAYREGTDSMVEWTDTPPLVTEEGELLDKLGNTIVVDTLPSPDGAVTYHGLPEGRIVLQGRATFPVDLERRIWGQYESAQGDADISCTLVGMNPGRLQIECQARTPHFNQNASSSTEQAFGAFHLGPLPAAMVSEYISGTLQLEAEEVVFVVDTIDFPGAWGEQRPLNVTVRLSEQ